MLVSVSFGCCLDGLVGAILFRAAMIAVVSCLSEIAWVIEDRCSDLWAKTRLDWR